MRRHHPARSTPRGPEVDDDWDFTAADVLIEARGLEFDGMPIKQRSMTLRAARRFAETLPGNAHDGIAMSADDVNGISHRASPSSMHSSQMGSSRAETRFDLV